MSNTDTPSGKKAVPSNQLQEPPLPNSSTTRFENDFNRGFKPGGQHPSTSWANRPWHQRPRSPGLKWHKEYDTSESLKRGRVLLIDYAKQDPSKEGVRKVAAQEINDVEWLRKLYFNQESAGEPALRVIHVQNAPWATKFLLQKFNINSHDDLVGTDFGQFVKNKRPDRNGGKPFLNGKTWKTTHDPWRKISRMSFGIDYLKHYQVGRNFFQTPADLSEKIMELNCYDEEDNPRCGWNVYVQRLSCYVQQREISADVSPSPTIENPYNQGDTYLSRLSGFDNGNTIIIFEASHSGSIEDTLISARKKWESRWRRLPFYLAYEANDVSNDDLLATECMKLVLQDVWKGVEESWETFLDVCRRHVSILEDKIYEQPADETRAPELWTNSSMWLKVERLVSIHNAVVKEAQTHIRELTSESAVEDSWLETSTGDMERLSNLVQEDLVKPTASLADLMYKSVGIRDSRHSLQLNTSMWRLSWITFTFLPLTFLVGFFGMNVDTFQQNPSIKWYFVVAVPMMILVLLLWYAIKHFLASDRQTPYQRGIYEHLFHDLATKYPLLWSQSGPRDFVRPQRTMDRLKWGLVRYWNAPGKTIKAGAVGEDAQYDDDLGALSRLKRSLTLRWTSQIQNTTISDSGLSVDSLEEGATSGADMVSTGTIEATELLTLPVSHIAPKSIQIPSPMHKASVMLNVPSPSPGLGGTKPQSFSASSSRESSSAKRNSDVMVEEEQTTWLRELSEKSQR